MSYLGQGLGLGREERFTATATAGQTSITVDDTGRSISYTPGYVDVYLNGSKQVNGQDVTVSSGTSIVFASALTAGDMVDVVAPGYFQPADTVSRSLGGTFLGPVNLPSGGLNVGSGQLRVDSSGRVTKSAQPFARVYRRAGSNPSLTNGQTIIFNNADANIGGCYSTTNGRFTCPVAGVYLMESAIELNSASGDWAFNYGAHRNGSNIAGVFEAKITATYWAGRSYALVECAAGDYLEFKISTNITIQQQDSPGDVRNFAMFYLLG